MARKPGGIAPSVSEFRQSRTSVRAAIEDEVTELYKTTSKSLLRYSLLLVGNEDLAQETVQETFLKYYTYRLKAESPPSPRGWLFQVARGYILAQQKLRGTESCVGLYHAKNRPDERPSPENEFAQSEAVKRAFSLMTPRELECLRLRNEGFSYKEIAEILNIESGTVGALLARGVGKIQKEFGHPEDSCDTQ